MFDWRVAILAVLAMHGAAFADINPDVIARYNAAISSGSPSEIKPAAQALAAAAMGQPENPEAGLMAFEAAWTLCRFNACAGGVAPAAFAAAQDEPNAGAAVLEAYARWKTEPRKATRAALDAALEAEKDRPPTAVSVSAFRDIYFGDHRDRRWDTASAMARMAAQHFSLAGPAGRQYEIEARMLAIISDFVGVKYTERERLYGAVREMVNLSGELQREHRLADEPPAWLTDARWRADAWVLAMDAYFTTVSRPGLPQAERDAIIASYLDGVPEKEPEDNRPFCAGEVIQTPKLDYPTDAENRLLTGAVLIGFSIDEGRMTDFRVLASVPNDGFREQALKVVSQWTWKSTEDRAKTGCRTSWENAVQPLAFVFEK